MIIIEGKVQTPIPTLFLGHATVNDDKFDFNDSAVTAPTPVGQFDVTNKLYVDELVAVQAERLDAILSGTTIDLDSLKEIADYAAALGAAETASLESAVAQQSVATADLRTYVNTTKSHLESSDLSILSALADESSNRTMQDSILSANITSVGASFSSYVGSNNIRSGAIESSVVAERVARVAAETALHTDLINLSASQTAASISLEINIRTDFEVSVTNETSLRIRENEFLRSDMETEAIRRANADIALVDADALISSHLTAEIANRIAGDSSLDSAIDSLSAATDSSVAKLIAADQNAVVNLGKEIAERSAAITVVTTRIHDLETTEATHYAGLTSMDLSLSAQIASEAVSRAAADTQYSAELAGLTASSASSFSLLQVADINIISAANAAGAARIAADAALGLRVDGEISVRSAAVSTLQAVDSALGLRIDGESSTRSAAVITLQTADSALSTRINAEASTRTSSVSDINIRIQSEITARTNSDAGLSAQINNLLMTTDSSVGTLQQEIYDVMNGLSSEAGVRGEADADLLKKIDMLYLYFFHRDSKGAMIDEKNQIYFDEKYVPAEEKPMM